MLTLAFTKINRNRGAKNKEVGLTDTAKKNKIMATTGVFINSKKATNAK